MQLIRGKLADHIGDHVVSSPEGTILVTSPGTKSSYPRPPRSLNTSFPDFALQGGKVTSGVVEGRGEVVLVDNKKVVLLVLLVVCELSGGNRRLGLRGCNALLHVVEGYLEHLPFGGGGDSVPERGERTHVRRRGGKGGGDRGAGALVPGAV